MPISLPVRYCDMNPAEGPWVEERFELKELTWELEPAETALILVDVWDNHPYESHLKRGEQITRGRIAPLVDWCRRAGVTVVHAPSPGQAKLYPQWVRYAGDRELGAAPSSPGDDWPPADFRSRAGDYEKFAKPKSERRERWLKEELPKRRIMACVEPQLEDFVISTGEQLHRLLRHRRILHLLYAGFAANMCVLHRDYGIEAMFKRGYNIILLRDCTTAIESAETFPAMAHTQAAISIVEMIWGVSATSDALLANEVGSRR